MDSFLRMYELKLHWGEPICGIFSMSTYVDREFCVNSRNGKIFNLKKENGILEEVQGEQENWYNFSLEKIKEILNSQLTNQDNFHFIIDDSMVKAVENKMQMTGAEIKLLQYEIDDKEKCEDQIDLKASLEKLLSKELNLNYIMINIEEHKIRYANTVKELNKISCENLIHLKATYWKKRSNFEDDLTFIMQFLSQFNPKIKSQKYNFDQFSETTDKNICIQDGPLACYCSHVRAMIYGYTNFEDITIIVEDDISIINTEKIEKYLSQISDDWDVICLGSIAKNRVNSSQDTFYKFTTDFHSTHFYIIRNRCFPKIFGGLYPITDQVDVLLSNLKDEINIYNIPYTVLQRNIGTNTQNNLHTIFNSPNYSFLRTQLSIIKKNILFFCDLFLPNNHHRNSIITNHLMYDILHEYVLKSGMDGTDSLYKETFDINLDEYDELNCNECKELFEALLLFIRCCKKGIEPKQITESLIKNFIFTIKNFDLHLIYFNHRDTNKLKAYAFGSTAHVYYCDDKSIIKIYNSKLRWTTDKHDNPDEIIKNEVKILDFIKDCKHSPKLIDFGKNFIKMTYNGESLYDNFSLPENWKEQIKEAFNEFDAVGVYYPEFRLQNILVNNGTIYFVDYGMAELISKNNSTNCEKFCNLLNILNDKFKNIVNLDERQMLISTFFRNLNLENAN